VSRVIKLIESRVLAELGAGEERDGELFFSKYRVSVLQDENTQD
jgi:hypothetical protein